MLRKRWGVDGRSVPVTPSSRSWVDLGLSSKGEAAANRHDQILLLSAAVGPVQVAGEGEPSAPTARDGARTHRRNAAGSAPTDSYSCARVMQNILVNDQGEYPSSSLPIKLHTETRSGNSVTETRSGRVVSHGNSVGSGGQSRKLGRFWLVVVMNVVVVPSRIRPWLCATRLPHLLALQLLETQLYVRHHLLHLRQHLLQH